MKPETETTTVSGQKRRQLKPNFVWYEENKTKQRTSQEMYVEVCNSDAADEITSFNKLNDKVAISLGPNSSRMRPVSYVSDTGGGPNLLREAVVEPDRMSLIGIRKKPKLRGTTSQKVGAIGTTVLPVQIEEPPYASFLGSSRT